MNLFSLVIKAFYFDYCKLYWIASDKKTLQYNDFRSKIFNIFLADSTLVSEL